MFLMKYLKSTLKDDPVDTATMAKIKTTPNKTDIDLLNQYLTSIEKYDNKIEKFIQKKKRN